MRHLSIALCIATAACSSAAQAQFWDFSDVTASAGATVVHGLNWGYSGEPSMMTGGMAAADVNADGWIDLFVLRGDQLAPVMLINQGDGSFSDEALARGLAFTSVCTGVVATPCGLPNGAVFADVDGNGAPDLLVGGLEHASEAGGLAPPRLFLNDGNGMFSETDVSELVDANAVTCLGDCRNTWSAAFGDYDRDGDLDLALAHWSKGAGGVGGSGQLWRNDGSGNFVDVALAAGISGVPLGAHTDPDAPPICLARNTGAFTDQDYSFTPNFADIDNDGWPDLLIAADFCTSRVFRNNQDGSFTHATTAAIQDENGMGAAIGDYDNDGDLDWFVTSILDSDGELFGGNRGITGNKLYINNGNGVFSEGAAAAGIDAGDWGWGACFADFDNDGWLDLFHVNGMNLPSCGTGSGEQQFCADKAKLFINNHDGSFTEQATLRGADDAGQGRGVACFDYDRDGDVDVYLNNQVGTGRLLRNDGGNSNHWLGVRLQRDQGNRFGIGARLSLHTDSGTQTREIRAGNAFLSSAPAEAHFGLGESTTFRLEVRWPDGSREWRDGVDSDRLIEFDGRCPLNSGFE